MKELEQILEALNEWAKENLATADKETEARFWAELYQINHQLEGLRYAQ